MRPSTIQEIERAIDALAPEQIEELYLWPERHHPQPIHARVQSDLATGRLDEAIQRALDDEQSGRVRPVVAPDAASGQC
jgi:hypothetical protein